MRLLSCCDGVIFDLGFFSGTFGFLFSIWWRNWDRFSLHYSCYSLLIWIPLPPPRLRFAFAASGESRFWLIGGEPACKMDIVYFLPPRCNYWFPVVWRRMAFFGKLAFPPWATPALSSLYWSSGILLDSWLLSFGPYSILCLRVPCLEAEAGTW